MSQWWWGSVYIGFGIVVVDGGGGGGVDMGRGRVRMVVGARGVSYSMPGAHYPAKAGPWQREDICFT